MGIVHKYNRDIKKMQEGEMEIVVENLKRYIETIYTKFITAKRVEITSAEYFTIATGAMDSSFNLFYGAMPILDGLLRERLKMNLLKRNIVSGISIFAGFLIIIVSVGFYQSLTGGLYQMQNTAGKIAEGDLLQKEIEIESKDEIGQLAASFNKMTENLKKSRDETLSAKEYTDNIIKSMIDTLRSFSAELTSS